ncbi:alpha/beta hydrolase [Arthrobacter sp. EPSL27]|uniref:alpha/beta hydrolase n=1 Tax=Arthrobacter sp. EPSL27 TaxID=1745378 RepID=UPI000A6358CC|nr:alpha/beta hydrolase [Arthrobacter sp. EPSL27]
MTKTSRPNPEIQFLLDAPPSRERIAIFEGTPWDRAGQGVIVDTLRLMPSAKVAPFPIGETWDFPVGSRGTQVRGYRPLAVEGPLPIVVDFHGGGWVYGSVDTNDQSCRAIANSARCLVFNVGYGLAPENPFPGPLEECIEVTQWIIDNAESLGGDPGRIVVSGQSAGGNLAAAVVLHAAETGAFSITGQVLSYPALDATRSLPSHRENELGYILSAKEMEFYWLAYHQDRVDPETPELSPLFAADLSKLPPTIVLTSEFDVLRDEGEAYARRLTEAGVPTMLRRYAGQIHGLLGLGAVTPDAGHAISEIGAWLRALFASEV